MTNRGLFITFEGGDGCGKSTQVKLLAEYLKSKNIFSEEFLDYLRKYSTKEILDNDDIEVGLMAEQTITLPEMDYQRLEVVCHTFGDHSSPCCVLRFTNDFCKLHAQYVEYTDSGLKVYSREIMYGGGNQLYVKNGYVNGDVDNNVFIIYKVIGYK